MIRYKSAQEVEVIKESAQILGKAHAEVAKVIKPGVKTKDLDKIARFIAAARSASENRREQVGV